MKYRLYIYDVWGNSEDGYEVNDKFPQCTIEVADINNDEAIFDALTDEGYCINGVEINIEGDEQVLYFDSSIDGKPLAELRRVEP